MSRCPGNEMPRCPGKRNAQANEMPICHMRCPDAQRDAKREAKRDAKLNKMHS